MSEPSSAVPSEIADAEVERSDAEGGQDDQAEGVDLELNEEQVAAWDEVKGDYEVEPGGKPVPNSMDTGDTEAAAP
ncbi:hypothetical protein [Pedococcus sp. 5OH_020]|uniref:hypothetical protein n=1 Tax=Pedococcus sp. 5OH_020 TaxID=2989814 RepID=UPI0022E9F444|nr:hypothetical protein [Pedococcus sp. 5OH_020]